MMQELHPSLVKVVELAKSWGYHCYQTIWEHSQSGDCTYIHISNEDKSIVGCISIRYPYGGERVERSTCHKMTRDWGTGISIDYYDGRLPDDITKEWLDEIFSSSNFGIKKSIPVPSKLSVDEYIKDRRLKQENFVEL